MIVTDLKGEVFKATAGYRRRKGSQVFLVAAGSEATNRYNPLDFVRQERGTRTTDIQNMASILVPENTESENSVWQATAQQVMAGAISYVLESPHYNGRRHLGEINSFINSGVDLQALMKFIKAREPYLSKFCQHDGVTIPTLAKRALQHAEIGLPLRVGDERFTINHRIFCIEMTHSLDDGRKFARPIMQVAGEHAYLAGYEVDADPISVPFDLVQPIWSLGHIVDQSRVHWRDHALRHPLLVSDVRIDACPLHRYIAFLVRLCGHYRQIVG